MDLAPNAGHPGPPLPGSTSHALLGPPRVPEPGGRSSLLTLGRALCAFIREEHDAARREPPRLELLGELRHDLPPPSRNGPLDGPREGVFDGRFRWPKRDQLTRTYVNSRKVELTRVDVSRARVVRSGRVRVPSTPLTSLKNQAKPRLPKRDRSTGVVSRRTMAREIVHGFGPAGSPARRVGENVFRIK